MPTRSPLRRAAPLALACVPACVLAVSGVGLAATGTAAAPRWAPAARAAIHPGILTDTQGGHCTANFVYSDASGGVYLGQAAHCSGTGDATETDGCLAASLPLGTPVVLHGSGVTGTLAYSSWITMQQRGETDAHACAHNDFALVKIPARAARLVNPSVPFWGGPVGLDTDGTRPLETVLSYGNSPLRGGIAQFSPKQGKSLGSTAGGWSHPVYTLSPGVPGDSGSAFLDAHGRAIGALSTLALTPLPLSNGVGDLAHEVGYARRYSGISGLKLEKGTQPFRGPLAP